jgi:hypothetical protein
MTALDPAAEQYREPLLWVTSTSGWEEEELIARLLPPAETLNTSALGDPPPHPYLVVVARETQPACEVLLRQYGLVAERDGSTRQHVPGGWTIAATIFIATAPGKPEKEFRNYAAALAADDKRMVMRIPFIREWRLSPIAQLPRWDFTPTTRGRTGPQRRADGLPASVADHFDRLMRHVSTLPTGTTARSPDSTPDIETSDTTDQQCA